MARTRGLPGDGDRHFGWLHCRVWGVIIWSSWNISEMDCNEEEKGLGISSNDYMLSDRIFLDFPNF